MGVLFLPLSLRLARSTFLRHLEMRLSQDFLIEDYLEDFPYKHWDCLDQATELDRCELRVLVSLQQQLPDD